MFSENEIVFQCRQCKGRCDEIKKCPLKIEWQAERESRIFPSIPGTRNLFVAGKCENVPASDKYSTEELIAGLNRLNGHL